MTLQSVFKHFLTEGDRFLVSKFSELEDQGGYAIATNYGSLIARIVFQPIEETSRIFFSKLLSIPSAPAPSSSSTASLTTKKNSDAPETIAGADEQRTRLGQAASTSQLILLLYTHLSLVFIVFGPPFVPTLASFLLPRRYVLNTSAPAVLQAYCLYLPVMALNGFLEALMASVAEPRDLARQSRFMGAASILFVLSAVGFSRLGGESGGAAGGAKSGGGMKETGMVYANVLNLGSRAIYGWFFMSAYFRRASAASSSSSGSASLLDGWKCLPPRSVWLVSAVIGIILRASASHYGGLVSPLASKGTHLAIGVLHFVIWIIVCWWTERDIIAQLVKLLRARRAKAE
ncbi:Rft-1-domain-containing protein [Clavulina sp. PMI_390]|nr:Rft-1-domain-containing protein [Clavulina sp. PMI_390]